MVSGGSVSIVGGVCFIVVWFLGVGNGSRSLGFGGGNGFMGRLSSNKFLIVSNVGGFVGLGSSFLIFFYDGEGIYLIFNVGDVIFISDYYF